MSAYLDLLGGMMEAILAGDAAPADELLRGQPDFPARAQMNAYIEGYRLRLKEAVAGAYPALLHYLGKAPFDRLAAGFIGAHPSRYFNLDKYPVAFADYVSRHSEDARARDLAMLEGAIHDVYQREETAAVDALWAQSQTPETLASAPLCLRVASRLLALATDADGYLTALREGREPDRPALHENKLLVLRHKNHVRRLLLEEGEYALLALLGEGLTLAAAFDDARLAHYLDKDDFAPSLQGWLARWVGEGVLRQP